jgi:hypothetical protein
LTGSLLSSDRQRFYQIHSRPRYRPFGIAAKAEKREYARITLNPAVEANREAEIHLESTRSAVSAQAETLANICDDSVFSRHGFPLSRE